MRYNRGSIQDTIRVARLGAIKNKVNYYIFGTYYGYTMSLSKPPTSQRYLVVMPSGVVNEIAPDWEKEAGIA